MFKNTFQSGFLSILYSIGSKPLQIWDKEGAASLLLVAASQLKLISQYKLSCCCVIAASGILHEPGTHHTCLPGEGPHSLPAHSPPGTMSHPAPCPLLLAAAVQNGHIKRVTDEDIQSSVLEIISTNVSTTYITCPADPAKTLGIKLPFLVMIVKNLNKYFTFEVQVLDDKNVRRRFRASNYQVCSGA
jgi:hypothetical protein